MGRCNDAAAAGEVRMWIVRCAPASRLLQETIMDRQSFTFALAGLLTAAIAAPRGREDDMSIVVPT
jgi:hypothetical protein